MPLVAFGIRHAGEGAPMPDSTPTAIEFFFDPVCPWTWRTSRWVRRVAAASGLDLRWRPFSLKLNAPDADDIPPQFRIGGEMGAIALRLIARLDGRGERDTIDRFYTALGTRVHIDGVAAHPDVARQVATELGLDTAALDDQSLDATLRSSIEEALALVGDGVGSPIVAITFADGVRRAFFGPVIAAPATGEVTEGDDARIWDAVVTLARADAFSEMKRGRTLPRAG
jgi:2-hydroxychromene-2-carboxylate isomerase